jgi:hypothetical protein
VGSVTVPEMVPRDSCAMDCRGARKSATAKTKEQASTMRRQPILRFWEGGCRMFPGPVFELELNFSLDIDTFLFQSGQSPLESFINDGSAVCDALGFSWWVVWYDHS